LKIGFIEKKVKFLELMEYNSPQIQDS
jgi:hypothetical protein